MKEKKTVESRTEYEKVTKLVCDICKCHVSNPKNGDQWTTQDYEILETRIELREGTSYPGDYYAELTSFDICPNCFREKLVPWMRSNGAEPSTKSEG